MKSFAKIAGGFSNLKQNDCKKLWGTQKSLTQQYDKKIERTVQDQYKTSTGRVQNGSNVS
jgi:hypothetical protein